MLAWLERWIVGPDTDDGLAGGIADELRRSRRARTCRRRAVPWRKPTREEAKRWDEHPLIGRFADDTVALAAVEGRCWIVRERIWHGCPDPERFVLFVLDREEVWAAGDFDYWPRAWRNGGFEV